MGRDVARVAACAAVAALVATLYASPSAQSQARPLPEPGRFFEAARSNLERSESTQANYAYSERRKELHTNPFGRLGSGEGSEVFEVTPLPEGGVSRRLVERDGMPVVGAPAEESARRTRIRRSVVDDTAAALDLAIARRDRLSGRDAIVVAFSPKSGARPETRQGRLARQFRGEIWVDEEDAEVMRVDARAVDDLTYGLGVVARVNKGATVTLVRERIDGMTWLPTSIRLMGEGRAMLFRRLQIDHVIEWFHYRLVR